MKYNPNDYVEVNVRLEKFWNDHPKGRVATEIIKWDGGIVGIKASIYKDIKDDNPISTGHAYEKENSTFVNKTSYVENCETSAVGRALALMGYEIKKGIASKEEVENAKHQQAEADKKKTTPKPKSKTWKVDGKDYTEGAIKNLMMKKHGNKDDAKQEWDMFETLDLEDQVGIIKEMIEEVAA
jgi:hypothetical protein